MGKPLATTFLHSRGGDVGFLPSSGIDPLFLQNCVPADYEFPLVASRLPAGTGMQSCQSLRGAVVPGERCKVHDPAEAQPEGRMRPNATAPLA